MKKGQFIQRLKDCCSYGIHCMLNVKVAKPYKEIDRLAQFQAQLFLHVPQGWATLFHRIIVHKTLQWHALNHLFLEIFGNQTTPLQLHKLCLVSLNGIHHSSVSGSKILIVKNYRENSSSSIISINVQFDQNLWLSFRRHQRWTLNIRMERKWKQSFLQQWKNLSLIVQILPSKRNMISASNFFISQLEYYRKSRTMNFPSSRFVPFLGNTESILKNVLTMRHVDVHISVEKAWWNEDEASSVAPVFFRWQGWVLRSQCCRRHRRKIQTIARLSPPVIVASVPFVESRREECHPEEEPRSPRGNRSPREDGRCGGTRHGNNECRRHRRRRRVCCTRPGCDRWPGRRWGCSTIGRLASFNSRPKRRGEASFTRREGLHAPRRALVSFVLFLPADDDSYDLLSPLHDPWSRWITT